MKQQANRVRLTAGLVDAFTCPPESSKQVVFPQPSLRLITACEKLDFLPRIRDCFFKLKLDIQYTRRKNG